MNSSQSPAKRTPAPVDEVRSAGFLAPREAYDRAAPFYDDWEWQEFWRRNELPLVLSEVGRLEIAGPVLDAGTGTGLYAEAVREAGLDVVGVDVSYEMLRQAHRRLGGGAHLVQADIGSLPFRNNSFSAAMATRVFSHIGDLGAALRELRRVLRRPGHLVVADIDAAHDYPYTELQSAAGKLRVVTHKRTLEEFLHVARASGFSLGESVPLSAANARWLPPEGALRRLDRTGQRPVGFIAVLRAEGA